MRGSLVALAALAGCDGPRVLEENLEGVGYTVKLPPGYARTASPDYHAHVYRGPGGHLGPAVTVRLTEDWPADVEQLRGRVAHAGATIPHLEARPDGYVAELAEDDRTKVKVVVLRQEGERRLSCVGEGGFTSKPLADPDATRKQLLSVCDSVHVVR